MSFVFSKNREKRSRSSTGESTSSFVKNVTSRVSGLLPATITKWFSSPSSSSANGSMPISDGTDSSTEDEAPESPIMVQPPAKRLRYSSPVRKYNQLTTSETTFTSNVTTETRSVLYNSIKSPPGTFRREPALVATPLRSHTDEPTERPEREPCKSQHTVSDRGQSNPLKRKSLFETQTARGASHSNACAKTAAHTMKDVKQPYFKPHLLCSPFYPGRTMYGGASASSTYINQPNIKRRKDTNVNESQDLDSVNMSASARRVMDLLENYSSPLVEAKRIPRYDKNSIIDTRSSTLSGTANTEYSYKRQELYIPNQASIIRLKARNRLMDSTKAARQIIASHSSTLTPYPVSSEAASDKECSQAKSQKLKCKLTRPNRGQQSEEMPETVELPNVMLHIDKDNLPKFSFNPLANSTHTFTPLPVTAGSNKSSEKPDYPTFKFSIPDSVITETKKPLCSPPPPFDFGSPERTDTANSPTNNRFGVTVPEKRDGPALANNIEKSVKTFAKTPNEWKCSECWVSNKTDSQKCVCCGAKQPSRQNSSIPSKCTICKVADSLRNTEKCANCEKVSTHNINSVPLTKAVSSKWTCDGCWVSNDVSADKCICCGGCNPKKGSSPSVADKKQAAEKDWRCADCFITNKPSEERCAACSGAKPGTKPIAKPISTNLFNNPDNKLKEIVQSQKDSWECRVCLACNPHNKSMCACCEAEREVPSTVASKYTNFKFSTTPNPGFKFGIDPVVQESNIAKKIDEKSKPKNAEESETNNNVVPKIPSYTFKLPNKKLSDKVADPEIDEGPKPSFSFGIPKQNAMPTDTTFVPIKPPSTTKLPTTVTPVEEEKKAQEVPVVTFTTPVPAKAETDKPTSGLFASSTPQSNSSQFAPSASLLTNPVEQNKTEPTPSIQPAQSEKSTAQFPFSSNSVPTTSMFAPLSTAATTGSTLTAPIVPAITTAPTVSMFQNPAPATSPAPSFFQKSEATILPTNNLFSNSTATPSPAASMFTFGSGQSVAAAAPAPALAPTPAPTPAPAAETQNKFSFGFSSSQSTATPAPTTDPPKKFNFSFGSSTAPAFGAAQRPAANAFALPSNPLASNGLSLGGNTLGTGLAPAVGSMNPPSALLGAGGGVSIYNPPAKDQMWPSTDQNNMNNTFMANATAKPAFSFGAPTSTSTPFGGGASAQPVVFGATAQSQPAQSMFGQSDTQSPMFPSPAPSQTASMFGNPQPANPAPMFGSAPVQTFGSSMPSQITFDSSTMLQSSFNFGTQPSASTVFGFGEQGSAQPQQQMQQMQSNFCFGGGGIASPSSGNVQFSMGLGGAPSARRVRKAVRRNTPR